MITLHLRLYRLFKLIYIYVLHAVLPKEGIEGKYTWL